MQAPDQATLGTLLTEARNPATEHLDQLSTLDMLRVINDEDATIAAAVRTQLPQIAQAVDAIAARFEQGGRLVYIGAGTSGRLGVLDASECPPTFSVPADLFQGLIAGGDRALRLSSEHSEDSPGEGAADLAATGFTAEDSVIGIAASGRTPYVLGALAHAKGIGALTIALTCVPGSPIAQTADIAITPATGPEVLTGSTRLKAGTATKLILNMLSTGIMVRSGATYGNLMVNVRPTNAKLLDRALRILIAATGCTRDEAADALHACGNQLKQAILTRKLHLTPAEAEAKLKAARGVLATALRP